MHIRCLIIEMSGSSPRSNLGSHIKAGDSPSSGDTKQPALGPVCFCYSVMPSISTPDEPLLPTAP